MDGRIVCLFLFLLNETTRHWWMDGWVFVVWISGRKCSLLDSLSSMLERNARFLYSSLMDWSLNDRSSHIDLIYLNVLFCSLF